MKKAILIVFASFVAAYLPAQLSQINGIINNTATVVNSVDGVNNLANVVSTSGFSIGDTILMIQMQGATMNTSNTSAFGDISNLNNAGNYEFNIICDVDASSSNIVFQNQLVNAYDAGGGVQLIRVPTYENVRVNGTLTANPWNGTTGGVLVFWARGYAQLQGGITMWMDTMGFRGGDYLRIADPCGCGFSDPQYSDYYYPYNDHRGAHKGEGIAGYTASREGGRGKNATGGGGGNDHNGGGAGGANYGTGGNGGQPCATRSCFLGQYCRGFFPGIGSADLAASYNNSQNRIFLGGGGGAGDSNDSNGAGSGGTNGGGIIIIVADSLAPNGANIYARGRQPATGAGDGVGGGGAGGTVLISTRATHPTQNMNVYVNGGNGGNSSWFSTSSVYNSKGKGGGGGGGVFWFSGATVPGQYNIVTAGGAAGTELSNSCPGSTGGSQPGGDGAVLTGLNLNFGTASFGPCLLPVEYSYVKAEKAGTMSRISWGTFSEVNNDYFEIERSFDGTEFEVLGVQSSKGEFGEYDFLDVSPRSGTNFYRIRQVDIDGSSRHSKVLAVNFGDQEIAVVDLFPNPVPKSENLQARLALPSYEPALIQVVDAYGKIIYQDQFQPTDNFYDLNIPTAEWGGGVYFLKVSSGNSSPVIRRVVVME